MRYLATVPLLEADRPDAKDEILDIQSACATANAVKQRLIADRSSLVNDGWKIEF
jgi:hypothetical protein